MQNRDCTPESLLHRLPLSCLIHVALLNNQHLQLRICPHTRGVEFSLHPYTQPGRMEEAHHPQPASRPTRVLQCLSCFFPGSYLFLLLLAGVYFALLHPQGLWKIKRSKLEALIYSATSDKQLPKLPAQLMKYNTLATLKGRCDQYTLVVYCKPSSLERSAPHISFSMGAHPRERCLEKISFITKRLSDGTAPARGPPPKKNRSPSQATKPTLHLATHPIF